MLGTSACTKSLEVIGLEIQRQPLSIDSPRPLKLQNIEIIVITKENASQVFEYLERQNKDPVLFGLTDDGYETMAINNAKVRSYLILQNDILKKYREYYENVDGTKSGTSKKIQ